MIGSTISVGRDRIDYLEVELSTFSISPELYKIDNQEDAMKQTNK